jgi:hypothetical protein
MKITEFLTDIGRPVAFHPGLKKITGSTTATLFLCQLIYWTGKQADPEGWIYKTSPEIEDETGLTYYEQTTARKQLIKLGFIEEDYKRLDHQMVFRIMANAIDAAWRTWHDHFAEPDNTRLGNAASPGSFNSNSENTPQITTENTQRVEQSAAAAASPMAVYCSVTDRMGFPGSQAAEDIGALMTIMAREVDPISYLRPFYSEFKKRYKTSLKDFWLTDWAVVGQIPDGKAATGAPAAGTGSKHDAAMAEFQAKLKRIEAANGK